ncbi:hypothetical protein FORC2_p096 (plasmid) [Yersinia enterocolitica]|nr:hypothetical protein FORC2_p096 [Yersinia enterocolitica]
MRRGHLRLMAPAGANRQLHSAKRVPRQASQNPASGFLASG